MDSELEKKLEELARRVEALELSLRHQARAIREIQSEKGASTLGKAEGAEAPVVPAPPAPAVPVPPETPAMPPRPRGIKVSTPALVHRKPGQRVDLETVIGGSLLNRIGMLAVFLGAAYFLKLAYDNQWIGPLGRTTIGILAGAGFLVAGERIRGKGLQAYGQVLSGGGIAILYLSLFAAFQFWRVLSQPAAFLAMMAVTATATILSGLTNAPFIALLGTLGGFLTPALLSTGVDNQIELFSYVFLLDLGLLAAAYLRGWGFLALLALTLTEVTWVGWANAFYETPKWIRTELLLTLFFGLFAGAGVVLSRRGGGGLGKAILALNGAAFFIGSTLNLFEQPRSLLAFLCLFNAALPVAVRAKSAGLSRQASFALSFLVWLSWLVSRYADPLRPLALSYLTLFFATHLAASARAFFQRVRPGWAEYGVTFANGGFFYGALYHLLERDHPSLVGPLAVAVGVPYFLLGQRLYRKRPEVLLPVYILLGIALTFLTLAIPIQLDQHWITLAWAVEGAILTWIGFRAGSPNTRRAAAAVLALALARVTVFESALPAESYRLLFNRRVFAWLSVAAALLASAFFYRRGEAARPASGARDEPAVAGQKLAATGSLMPHVYVLAAAFLIFLVGSLETEDFFRQRQAAAARSALVTPGETLLGLRYLQRMSLSIFWALYAGSLIAMGIARGYRPIRWLGIVIFGVTVLKVFLVDLSALEQIYRVLSFVVTGLLLLGASYLYQRLVRGRGEAGESE